MTETKTQRPPTVMSRIADAYAELEKQGLRVSSLKVCPTVAFYLVANTNFMDTEYDLEKIKKGLVGYLFAADVQLDFNLPRGHVEASDSLNAVPTVIRDVLL